MSKKLLIVADDFGYGHSRNRGIVQCFKENAISAVSILPNCKYSYDAVQLAKSFDVPVGLHFNITEGLPLSDPNSVRSLLGSNGKFLGKLAFWNKSSISLEHVSIELKSQIQWFSDHFGCVPYRVDGHQHANVHPKVAGVFASVLKMLGVKTTRLPIEHPSSTVSNKISHQRLSFHSVVQHASEMAKPLFQNCGIEFAEAFIGLNLFGKAMNVQTLQNALKNLFESSAMSCELMAHPGYKCNKTSDGFLGDECADEFSCSADREHEFTVLTSSEMLQFYKDEKISLESLF